MPFTATKLGAVQGSVIVVVSERRPRRTEAWADQDVGGGMILEESESPLLLRPIERQGTNEPAHGDTGGDIAIGDCSDDAR